MKKILVAVRMTEKLHNKLKTKACEKGISINSLALDKIEKGVDEEKEDLEKRIKLLERCIFKEAFEKKD